jgi:hypothetical protein
MHMCKGHVNDPCFPSCHRGGKKARTASPHHSGESGHPCCPQTASRSLLGSCGHLRQDAFHFVSPHLHVSVFVVHVDVDVVCLLQLLQDAWPPHAHAPSCAKSRLGQKGQTPTGHHRPTGQHAPHHDPHRDFHELFSVTFSSLAPFSLSHCRLTPALHVVLLQHLLAQVHQSTLPLHCCLRSPSNCLPS